MNSPASSARSFPVFFAATGVGLTLLGIAAVVCLVQALTGPDMLHQGSSIAVLSTQVLSALVGITTCACAAFGIRPGWFGRWLAVLFFVTGWDLLSFLISMRLVDAGSWSAPMVAILTAVALGLVGLPLVAFVLGDEPGWRRRWGVGLALLGTLLNLVLFPVLTVSAAAGFVA